MEWGEPRPGRGLHRAGGGGGCAGRRCPPASTDVCALVSPAECVCALVWARRRLGVWMFTCVRRQMPSLCASLARSRGCEGAGVGAPVAGRGPVSPCESISGSVSLCLYVRRRGQWGMYFGKREVDQAYENRKGRMWGKAGSWGGCLRGRVERMNQAGPDGFGMGCGVGAQRSWGCWVWQTPKRMG